MVTEREEEVEISNAKIEEINKDKEKEDDEIDRLLNKLFKESDGGDVNTDDEPKKRQNGLLEYLNGLFKEEREQAKRSMKDHMDESLGKAPKRTRIVTESDEEKTTTKMAKEAELEESVSSAMDPLEITEEIVWKYDEFVDYMIQMLNEERKDEKLQMQRWTKVLKRGIHLVETLNQRLKRVAREMERMKNDENLHKEYSFRRIHVPDLIAQLLGMNSRIVTSPNIRIVSGTNCTEKVVGLCLDELEKSHEELSEMMEVIMELKELNTGEEEEEEETEIA